MTGTPNPNFNILDTVVGDRVLNASAITAIMGGGFAPETFVNLTVTGVCTLSGSVTGAAMTNYMASPAAIGGTAPAAVTTNSFRLDTGTKTASATGGAATLNKMAGVITSEALTTAAGDTYTLTLTNSDIAAADQVMASVSFGTATTGIPMVTTVEAGSNSVIINVINNDTLAAFNGTINISFVVFKN